MVHYVYMEKKETEALIDDVLTRGVEEFIDPEGKFKEGLLNKALGNNTKEIIIKFGVDPTRPDIHLGHAVILHKLRKLQDLGCKVVFLVGDFTAQIGDPTGKSKVRPKIDQKQVEQNMVTYLEQIGRILRVQRDPKTNVPIDSPEFSWIRNSDWFLGVTDLMVPESVTYKEKDKDGNTTGQVVFPKNSFMAKSAVFENSRMQKSFLKKKGEIQNVTFRSFLFGLSHITHARLVERDMFRERIDSGAELYMHEMMYPVLQGIDSNVLNLIYSTCDLEVGGTDQIFNMLMGRDTMRHDNIEPQAVLAFKLLEGTDGKEKMSKSLDNYIGITDTPNDMYGKVMSVPDSSLVNYFELCTFTKKEEIKNISTELEKRKTNPRDLKMRLAHQIVSMYHGEEAAQSAEAAFVEVFQKKNIPNDMTEVEVEKNTLLIDVLLSHDIVPSKSEFRRLIEGKAVKILDGQKETVVDTIEYAVAEPTVVKVGKRRFIKVNIK